jgi:hypothetical protein
MNSRIFLVVVLALGACKQASAPAPASAPSQTVRIEPKADYDAQFARTLSERLPALVEANTKAVCKPSQECIGRNQDLLRMVTELGTFARDAQVSSATESVRAEVQTAMDSQAEAVRLRLAWLDGGPKELLAKSTRVLKRALGEIEQANESTQALIAARKRMESGVDIPPDAQVLRDAQAAAEGSLTASQKARFGGAEYRRFAVRDVAVDQFEKDQAVAVVSYQFQYGEPGAGTGWMKAEYRLLYRKGAGFWKLQDARADVVVQ